MENVDSVAVFYADGTYKHVTWNAFADLQGPLTRKIVQIHVYTVQTPGYPGLTVVNGFPDYCGRRTADGLIVRYGTMLDANPPQAFECFFVHGEQNLQVNVEIPHELCMSGMSVAFASLEFDDPNFDDLDGRAGAMDLRQETVPGSGTF